MTTADAFAYYVGFFLNVANLQALPVTVHYDGRLCAPDPSGLPPVACTRHMGKGTFKIVMTPELEGMKGCVAYAAAHEVGHVALDRNDQALYSRTGMYVS